jgi:predicted nuclease of predicted toxin-antitoxin system
MRFLLDANMPRSAGAMLQERGHAVELARDVGLGGASDQQVAKHAATQGATLITRDLDFADIRRYPPAEHPGIVVLRLPDDAVASEVVQVLGKFLERADLISRLPGHLAILEPHRVRFRPPI